MMRTLRNREPIFRVLIFMQEKIVVIGSDHNGVALKSEVKKTLKELGYHCIDIGPHNDSEKVDYVDYAKIAGHVVNNGDARWGILVCGTGVGMSITANRFPNVRASLVHSVDVAKKTREHNDANILCVGAWINTPEQNLNIVRAWFGTSFGEGRHVKRVEKIKEHSREKVVFTNGIFDVLHKGHIELLKFSKSLGGKLVVGINSDRATKELKGPDRPINSAIERKSTLENFNFVDEVVIFDDAKTFDIINEIQPDIVVKGGEWTAEEVRKRDQIPAHMEIKIYPLVTHPSGVKYSTTEIVERIKLKR